MARKPTEDTPSPLPRPTIWRHGDGIYSIDGGEPLAVSDAHEAFLEAFVNIPALTAKMIRIRAIKSKHPFPLRNVSRTADEINRLFGMAVIIKPGRKSRGGFRGTVKHASAVSIRIYRQEMGEDDPVISPA